MKEKIAKWFKSEILKERKVHIPTLEEESWESLYPSTQDGWCRRIDGLISLLKEEIKKSLLTDKEIDKQYIDDWARRNTGVDSPLQLKIEDDDEDIDVLRELAQAQLDKVLKALES